MNREFYKNLIEKLGRMSERDILSTEKDGAYFDALSPDRTNVVEWFPFQKNQTVLQAGAACGAFSPLAGRVASWNIYDADPLALNVAKARLEAAARSRENRSECSSDSRIEKRGAEADAFAAESDSSPAGQRENSLPESVFGNIKFTETLPEKHYDILFLAQWPGEEKAGELISTVKPDIVLALAENADALKFVTGAARNPEENYATAEMLESLGAVPAAGDRTQFRLYYPLPSLNHAKDIRSDKALPGPGDFRGVAANYSDERLLACDEEALYDSFASFDPKLIRKFAPGYLAVYIISGRGSKKSASGIGGKTEKTVAQGEKNTEKTAETAEKEVDIKLPDYIRYNRSRRPETQIRTDLYAGREVIKSALTPEADAHIRGFEDRYKLLSSRVPKHSDHPERPDFPDHPKCPERPDFPDHPKLPEHPDFPDHPKLPEHPDFPDHPKLPERPDFSGQPNFRGCPEVLPPTVFVNENGRAAASFPFVSGRSLGLRLAKLIRNGHAPVKEMEEALARMLGTGDGASFPGTETGLAFQESGAGLPSQGEQILPQYNIDLLFDNVLEENGKEYLSDYEWVSDTPLDPRFVRYRALRYFYEDNAQSLTDYRNLAEYLKAFGFPKEEQSKFEQMEDEFQLKVHGSDKGSFEDRFRRPSNSVTRIRENARMQYADQVNELKATLSKEREVERLSQQHISNIETMNRQKDAQIEALQAEIAYLRKHASLGAKAKRKLIAKLDVWAPADSDRRIVIKHVKGTVRHPSVYIKNYLTAEGHRYMDGSFAIRGEFLEAGILEIPKVPEGRRPLVSVIIPAYNQVGYTYACIRSIIEHTDAASTPYEVILADDASSDATSRITDWIHNLKVARTSGNLGFLKNCNNAAGQAQGEYLFFLNNDTKVTDGWLSSLIALMERDETIGMCGSKLVFPDGRLQEAGGIIWSDGSGWNYGRRDDPAKCAYNYVKDVDYISGAAILIRKKLWEEIGGFDERYAPAYCEDSDLAFEVRRHGKRVVYQPDSVVIHFEGVSNGTDVNGTGLKHYQLVNQEKFREKWAAELKEQSVNTGNPNPFAARERSQKKKTILVIDHYVPMWDRDAGSKTTYQYLKMFLKKGYNVKFLGDDFRSGQPYTHELEQMGIEVLYGNEMRTGVYRWLEDNRDFIGIAYLNRPHIASKYLDYLKDNTKIKCIFYGHDLHYLRIRREFELTGDIAKQRESENWRGLEYQVMEKSDMVYYPSQDEIDEIHDRRPEIPAKAITAYIYDKPEKDSYDGNNVTVEPEKNSVTVEPENHNVTAEPDNHNVTAEPDNHNVTAEPDNRENSLHNCGSNAPSVGESSLHKKETCAKNETRAKNETCAKNETRTNSDFFHNKEGLLFVGGFKHPPNADGVLWFAKEIWPRIHEALPEIHFYVAGSSPTPEILKLNGKDNIDVLGFVSDERLNELYETTRITVVPLRYGAGVKGKVVEALDKDCVIVTTTVGAEGIPEAETAMEIVDAPEVFAARVIRLYQNETELAKRRAACAPLIRRHYSTDAAWSIIADDF